MGRRIAQAVGLGGGGRDSALQGLREREKERRRGGVRESGEGSASAWGGGRAPSLPPARPLFLTLASVYAACSWRPRSTLRIWAATRAVDWWTGGVRVRKRARGRRHSSSFFHVAPRLCPPALTFAGLRCPGLGSFGGGPGGLQGQVPLFQVVFVLWREVR